MKKILAPLALIILMSTMACTKQADPITSDTRIALGTVCTISLYEKGTQDLYDELFLRLNEIEQLMSPNIIDSELSKANDFAGFEKGSISADTYTVLEKSLEYARLTDGAFNPAIGPLVNLWAIGTDAARVPSQEEIEKAVLLSQWEKVLLTKEQNDYFVFLEEEGMALDLGGIAKGYAADELVEILHENNIYSAIIDLGGNIYALGEKENGDAWKVGIKNPFDSTGSPAVRVDLKNQSVVTSGVYERFFEQYGVRYHHLLDSKTGYPVNNGLMSVTIVTESSMLADVLSTAVFVLGKEKGLALLESLGENGFCITAEKEILATQELQGNLFVLDESFSLVEY